MFDHRGEGGAEIERGVGEEKLFLGRRIGGRTAETGGAPGADGADGFGFGAELRAGVEDIHFGGALKTLGEEEGEGGLGVGVNPADDGLHLRREQSDIDRVVGHEVGDKGLVAETAEEIGGVEIEVEKLASDSFPKGGLAGLVDVAAQFRDDGVVEAGGEGAEEKEAREREETAGAGAAVVRMKEKRTDLGRAAVEFLEVKDGDLFFDLERRVGVVLGADFVAVERFVAADAGGETAGADDRAGGGVLEHEEVVFAAGFFDAGGECAEGIVDAVAQEFLVGRERGHAAVDGRGEGDEAGEIGFADGAEEEHPEGSVEG